MTQREEGQTPTPDLIKMFPHGQTNTVAELRRRNAKQIARGIGMCAFWTGLILFVGYLNWVEQGRPK